METKQLNGYKIEFYSEEEKLNTKYEYEDAWINKIEYDARVAFMKGKLLYTGKVSEINEELVKKVVDIYQEGAYFEGYWEIQGYKGYEYAEYPCYDTAKDSFETLSKLPYCVITKN